MQHATSPRVLDARAAPIDALVDQMRELPSLPEAALEALHLLEDPNYDVRAVAGAVSRDPVLAMRIVGMGNSPFFGMGMRTSCVKTAILRLGERETRSAILSVAIMTSFPTLPAPLDVQRFWTFGMASAICSRRLAEDLGYPDSSSAYLGALVHRLGDAFLAISFPRRFAEVWRDSRGAKGALEEALNEMDPVDCEILVLRHYEQLTNVEAAEELGLDESTASKRYIRALRKLKGILDRKPGDPS